MPWADGVPALTCSPLAHGGGDSGDGGQAVKALAGTLRTDE